MRSHLRRRLGAIRKAAAAGDADGFDMAVHNLKHDAAFRKSNPRSALLADFLVATQMPRMMLNVRMAFPSKPRSTSTPDALSPDPDSDVVAEVPEDDADNSMLA